MHLLCTQVKSSSFVVRIADFDGFACGQYDVSGDGSWSQSLDWC